MQKPGETIEYSLRYNGLALVETDGTWIPFDSLSDGYRDVIKIIVDIAARMCILNPYLKEETLLKTPGVVIIDELDLSLHPSWQRKIVNTLTTIFPRVQFICASHSPFLIQSLKEGQLLSIDGEVQEEYAGQSIEDIAEDIMGVENPQYSDEKQRMYELAESYFSRLVCKIQYFFKRTARQKFSVGFILRANPFSHVTVYKFTENIKYNPQNIIVFYSRLSILEKERSQGRRHQRWICQGMLNTCLI